MSATTDATENLLGTILRGKYRIERVLGEGGMGTVVAAWDPDLERLVAIKLLRTEMLAHGDVVARFLREARAAAKLQSDHVARVIEVGSLDGGAPFMVMEYLEGHDLSQVARAQPPPPIAHAVRWVIEACRAIGEAHALGIVHRDLKPANLFLASRRDGPPRIKVLDFGISKLTDPPGADQPGAPRTSMTMGTPEYMSPEQILSTRDVDARSDIWALGVILYELCAGGVPYTGDSVTQIYTNIVKAPPPPIRLVRPAVPPELEAVILACLAADREKRIATIAELIQRLAPFAEGASEGSASLPLAALTSEAARGASTAPGIATDPRAGSSKRAKWPLALVALLLLGGGAAAFATITRPASVVAAPSVAELPVTEPTGAPTILAAAPAITVAPAPEPTGAPSTTEASPAHVVAPAPARSGSARRAPAKSAPNAPARRGDSYD